MRHVLSSQPSERVPMNYYSSTYACGDNKKDTSHSRKTARTWLRARRYDPKGTLWWQSTGQLSSNLLQRLVLMGIILGFAALWSLLRRPRTLAPCVLRVRIIGSLFYSCSQPVATHRRRVGCPIQNVIKGKSTTFGSVSWGTGLFPCLCSLTCHSLALPGGPSAYPWNRSRRT
jgi:hypothetical protein